MNDSPVLSPPAHALEKAFAPFRENIVGIEQTIRTPCGEQPLVYADWIASGRLYGPVEKRMLEDIGPFVANTHTETTLTGTLMTRAYQEARARIKKHVNAAPGDVLIATGTGMTGAINKFQRILGLRVPEKLSPYIRIPDAQRPVVFVTHMEHHSNQTSWHETICDVVCIEPGSDGLVDPDRLRDKLKAYANRPRKIGAFTACSNVTGIRTPYRTLARLMHEAGGLCFVDFAASAPYDSIDMQGDHPMEKLDALFFSPHKFLGGPGTPGVLVFDSALYGNHVPDHPGGGTVTFTNPWGLHAYFSDIESREDGGTPGFLQTMRAALAIEVKDQMGSANMRAREEQLMTRAMPRLCAISGLHVLAEQHHERLGVVSFFSESLHFNLFVRLLNDRFGVQVRGGCSCAGTYGHYLLHIDAAGSENIMARISSGDLTARPGWVRLSLHPTTPDAELDYLLDAIEEVAQHGETWAREYAYNKPRNIWAHAHPVQEPDVKRWFSF